MGQGVNMRYGKLQPYISVDINKIKIETTNTRSANTSATAANSARI
jgi:xanthine dehydrogenase molybdopterin-binding subunit B